MKQRKKRWEGIVLAALAVILVGNMARPLVLEAAGAGIRQNIYGTADTDITGNEDAGTGLTEEGTPSAGAEDGDGTGQNQGEGSTTGTDTGSSAGQTPGTNTGSSTDRNPTENTGNSTEQKPDTDPTAKAIARVSIDGTDTEYADMAEAWAAAEGKTAKLTLLGNVTTGAARSTAFVLSSGDMTLDLNGYKWTYQYVSDGEDKPASYDLIEIKGDASLTVKGTGSSAMVYAGSSTYKGACLYATGDSTLTIEGGTFSSNVSAPVYVDGATLNVRGGIFKAAGADESAITMNNGTFNMTGGEVQFGKLTLNNTNGSQDANIGGDSKLSNVTTKGKDALKLEDTAADGYKLQDANGGDVTASSNGSGQSGESASNVTSRASIGLQITAAPASSESPHPVQFAYTGEGQTITLTASYNVAGTPNIENVNVTAYNWKLSKDGTVDDTFSNTTPSCHFSSKYEDGKIKAGTYEYTVEVTYTYNVPNSDPDVAPTTQTGEDSATYTIKVLPIENGTITKKDSYKTEYIYEEPVTPSGSASFDVDSYVPDDVKRNLKWNYEWYEGASADESKKMSRTPEDVGIYTLKVTATDSPNYTATGTFQIEIKPRSVTPTLTGTPTKVYDGTTDVKDVKVVLEKEGGGTLSYENGELTVGSIAYENAGVGTGKTITASGIALSGNKAKNYTLTRNTATTTGSITQASLVLKVDVNPATQMVNNPVTVTVSVFGEDGTTPSDALTANDITVNVTGGSDPRPVLTSSGRGVFSGSYTTATAGDRSFSATVQVNDNYRIVNAASNNSVTFKEDIPKGEVSVKADKEEVTYGDEVTFTATVTKADGKDGDALGGGVQFYLDGEENTNKVGTAQSIKVSGDTAKITLDKSSLTAGDHKVTARFTSDTAEGASGDASVKVAKKPLTWNASGLKASKTEGKSDEVTVYGTLSVEGILDGEIKFVQPESMKTNGFKATEAGTYTVTVTPESGEWTFDPKEPENYELPDGDPEIKATVNALKELSNPPEAKDGNTYKLVMEEGLSQVPDGLKNTKFDTPEKIEAELKRILTSSGSYKEGNTAVYDVTLQVSTDDGKTWEEANADNFPKEGVLVTLPYPGGTGRYTHNFAVAHMFGESLFGHTSGTVEVPAVTKADNGLQFRVTGLSPIAVAWTEASNASTSPVGTAARRLLGVQTGDDSPILLYAGLTAGCVLVLLIITVVFLVRRKKK